MRLIGVLEGAFFFARWWIALRGHVARDLQAAAVVQRQLHDQLAGVQAVFRWFPGPKSQDAV